MEGSKRLYVDRIEKTEKGQIAIVEVNLGQFVPVPVDQFAEPVAEGDAVYQGSDGKWHVDKEATATRRQYIDKLMNELFKNGE